MGRIGPYSPQWVHGGSGHHAAGAPVNKFVVLGAACGLALALHDLQRVRDRRQIEATIAAADEYVWRRAMEDPKFMAEMERVRKDFDGATRAGEGPPNGR
jgi:hypothetical protein